MVLLTLIVEQEIVILVNARVQPNGLNKAQNSSVPSKGTAWRNFSCLRN